MIFKIKSENFTNSFVIILWNFSSLSTFSKAEFKRCQVLKKWWSETFFGWIFHDLAFILFFLHSFFIKEKGTKICWKCWEVDCMQKLSQCQYHYKEQILIEIYIFISRGHFGFLTAEWKTGLEVFMSTLRFIDSDNF